MGPLMLKPRFRAPDKLLAMLRTVNASRIIGSNTYEKAAAAATFGGLRIIVRSA